MNDIAIVFVGCATLIAAAPVLMGTWMVRKAVVGRRIRKTHAMIVESAMLRELTSRSDD